MDELRTDTRESRPDTWSVFAAFRRTRLTLARHLPSLPVALAYAERLRLERFHHQEAVFVIHDQSGDQVDGAAPLAASDSRPKTPPPTIVWQGERAAMGFQRAERALARAREARARVVETFETRLVRLRRLGISEATVLHEVAERHAELDRNSQAAIASMEAALGLLRGGTDP